MWKSWPGVLPICTCWSLPRRAPQQSVIVWRLIKTDLGLRAQTTSLDQNAAFLSTPSTLFCSSDLPYPPWRRGRAVCDGLFIAQHSSLHLYFLPVPVAPAAGDERRGRELSPAVAAACCVVGLQRHTLPGLEGCEIQHHRPAPCHYSPSEHHHWVPPLHFPLRGPCPGSSWPLPRPFVWVREVTIHSLEEQLLTSALTGLISHHSACHTGTGTEAVQVRWEMCQVFDHVVLGIGAYATFTESAPVYHDRGLHAAAEIGGSHGWMWTLELQERPDPILRVLIQLFSIVAVHSFILNFVNSCILL